MDPLALQIFLPTSQNHCNIFEALIPLHVHVGLYTTFNIGYEMTTTVYLLPNVAIHP